MDVDNTTEGQGGTDSSGIELEQSLLQQFSCLGTTDREDLIKQLQNLLGNSLNTETAAFFLDMNNWNLQAAICSYFDVELPHKLPSMTLVVDYPVNGGEPVPPNTLFMKCWEVQNNGSDWWPEHCVLQHTLGERLSGKVRVLLPPLGPGATHRINVDVTTPAKPGMYESRWRMCTDQGCYFGDTIVMIITVVDGDAMALSQQLSHMNELGHSPPPVVINPFVSPRPSSQVTFQDSIQPSQDQDSHMC